MHTLFMKMWYKLAMERGEEIKRYSQLLPQRITVSLEGSPHDDGIWAKVHEVANCYTQAASIAELPAMLTDAIHTHFEVPETYRQDLGQYVPIPQNHMRLEAMFRDLAEIQMRTSAGEEVRKEFGRAEACLA